MYVKDSYENWFSISPPFLPDNHGNKARMGCESDMRFNSSSSG